MKIINQTKQSVITTNAIYLDSFVDKSIGLLNPKFPRSLWFKTRFGIHTFGLKKPIDVLILNLHSEVVLIQKNLSPWWIYLYPPVYNQVIELPQNTIKNTNVKIGDKIKLVNETS